MKRVKHNPQFKNYSVSIIDNDVIETYDVIDIMGNEIEYENGFLPIANGKAYVDQLNGGIHYIFNLDLPSKVEANHLKELRRSMAIKNIFAYDVQQTFDMMKFIPYLIIILLVLFK